MDEFVEEQARLLTKWERAQANDGDLLDADADKEGLEAAARLIDERPEEGFRRLQSFANRGSPYGMIYVAWCYDAGTGVPRDWDQAQTWYRRAFEAGSDRGLLEYGAHLASMGQTAEAKRVYEVGWQRGFVPAVYRLIRLSLRPTLPLKKRLAWKPSLEWAAAAGHPAARYLLSKYLFRGWFGVSGIPRGVRLVCSHLAAVIRDDENRPIMV